MSVILLEKNMNVIDNISQLLNSHNITLHCAMSSIDLFNLISSNNDIDLIITEINLKKENGLHIIKKLKGSGIQIPIMILTSLAERTVFFEGIKAGAIDYIVKPFSSNLLLERINHYIGSAESSNKNPSLNFYDYLNKEIVKARKGKYDISFLMSTLHDPSETISKKMNKKYLDLIDHFFPEIRQQFFETDIIIKFGLQSTIAVLPFCSKENTEIVDKKIKDFFEVFKKNHIECEDCRLDNVFLTFPDEIKLKDNIISHLTMDMKELLEHEYEPVKK